MPFATSDGVDLHYETAGAGETVALLNDVGFGAWQWGWQHAALAGPFETLVSDPRGTGRSGGTADAVRVERLADDLEAVLRDHGARRVALVGSGLGGMVALDYARRYDRVRALALLGMALSGDAVDDDALDAMTSDGPDALAPCLTDAFRAAQSDVVEGIAAWRETDDAPPPVRAAQADAMRTFACDAPYEVGVPTLVLHGEADPVVPAAAGERLADALPDARFVALPGRHLAHVEASRPANDALAGFFEDVMG
ncbi:alpha/beta fold hydrolase [Halomarina ordinaria]|uniref:Alpha/beta fold hydrolase n=1 Tax=Halomarina ordinaria TaxID=3033939 RepID=A0ABD5UAJ6_9EURY|nr:alpha/beta hydrolase [Halomarina sp. PSRA2]